jgi:hypothetical protein
MDEVKSNAIMFLTVYPFDGFEVVSDKSIQDFANVVLNITSKGRRVMIRYASEMNGNWFAYGQQPTAFIASFRKVVDVFRKTITNRNMFAFIWAPNSGNGYPFSSPNDIRLKNVTDLKILDTNSDGITIF